MSSLWGPSGPIDLFSDPARVEMRFQQALREALQQGLFPGTSRNLDGDTMDALRQEAAEFPHGTPESIDQAYAAFDSFRSCFGNE